MSKICSFYKRKIIFLKKRLNPDEDILNLAFSTKTREKIERREKK